MNSAIDSKSGDEKPVDKSSEENQNGTTNAQKSASKPKETE